MPSVKIKQKTAGGTRMLEVEAAPAARVEAALSTPISAGAVVTVPEYTVGAQQIDVYVDGCRCNRGDTFTENGTSGETSTQITFTDAISTDYHVVVVVH